MFRIPLVIRDTSLVLIPRFGDWPWPLQVGLLVLLCIIPTTLVIWLYLYELRLLPPIRALALLVLRLCVLGLFLSILCLQPVLVHATTETLPGRVLIAVDRSSSMDVPDPQRTAVEKLRLARALRIAADICSDQQLDDWIGQYQEKGGVAWVGPEEFAGDVNRRRQAEADRSRQHDQVCQRVDALSRTQVGQRVLAPDGVKLVEAIAAKHRVEFVGFSQETWDVTRLEDLYTAHAKDPAETDRSKAAEGFSDLRLPLVRALERNGRDEGRILGVVMLSDGQHNWGTRPGSKAGELGDHQLPVYPVALGARKSPPDIAIAAVKAPSTVFKDVDAPVEVAFRVNGLPAQPLVVELKDPAQKVLDTRDLDHDGTDRTYTMRLQARLDKVGTQAMTVTVRSRAEQTVVKEISAENNSRPVVMNVADDKAKVLLVDGETRWEFHYLSSALARDRTMDVQNVVFDQPRLGQIPEEELKKVGNPARSLPTEADALASYHCIVLGDLSPTQLPLQERIRLEKYVADSGGTLVIVAGKRFMPLGYPLQGGGIGDESDPLLRLLPIEEPRMVLSQRGFPVTLSHEGRQVSFMQMEPTTERSDRRWAELPRHYWAVAGRAKPGATPLAYVADPPPGVALKNAGDLEREQAFIVRQSYGFGRVLFVGLDSTWRWRFKVGDTYHHRFWGQLMRWAASDKPLVAGNEYVRFGTREAVYRQGQQEIDLVVRIADETGPLKPDLLAGARIIRVDDKGKEEAVALVPLTRREAQPRVLQGKINDLPPGNYFVELVIPELNDKLLGPPDKDGQRGKLRATFTVAAPDSEEMIDLGTNWTLLEEVATRSGGKVFTPENATELVDLLTRKTVTRDLVTKHPFAEWWPTLLVFLGLVTAEWVGRKWAGLP